MEERDWEIIKTLYVYQNITRTARELFISQPSLTKRLRQIEEKLGFEIVKRGRRGVHFTKKGQYVAEYADEILSKFHEIREYVQVMKNRVEGTLKIGVSNYFAKYKLPVLLKQFKSAYPQVEFQVTTGWSKDIYQMVYNQNVHIGVVHGENQWPNQKYLLYTDPLCIATLNPITLNTLPEQPRIDYQTEFWLINLVDNWWVENFSRPPHIRMEVDSMEACKEMVAKGLGYSFFPQSVLNDKANMYKIKLMNQHGNLVMIDTWLLYAEEFTQMKLVSTFVDFIKDSDVKSGV